MINFHVFQVTWIWLLFPAALAALRPMSCRYGERGSLTAICTNATSYYFKMTGYRFDYLDETLLCLNCTLESLEAGTFDIPGNEIKTLVIRNSSIHTIRPRAFIGMIYMESLILSNNPIRNMYPGAFEGIRKVKYLELENAVHQLEPRVFEGLGILEVLILRKNQLKELKPGTFEGLHNLRILDLSSNYLSTVNSSFDPLVNLQLLRLDNNSIHTIYGNEFNYLKSLLVLNLDNNHLRNFSINLEQNNKLRTLKMASNALSSDSFQPETFRNLNSLEELDLSGNVFANLTPKFLYGLFRLRILNLSQNRFTSINTGSFSGLPHLRKLNVSSNQLKSLNLTGRLQLHSLDTLDASDNEIETFDYVSLITKAPRLKYVNLEENHLSCPLSTELETLFDTDNVNFLISYSGGMEKDCPKVEKTYEAIVKEVTEELIYPNVNDSLLVWLFILITLVILLVGVLFYVQFFILLRMNSGLFKSVRIMRNIGLNQRENV